MAIPPLYISIGAFVAVAIITIAWVVRHEFRLGRMLKGKGAKDLEDTINGLSQEIKELQKFRKDAEDYLTKVEARLTKSIKAPGVIRFNAFKGDGSGGGQSFAASFIDEKGDGTVISSLYSRDRVSVFAKPIKKLASDYELTDEEKQAINLSKKSIDGI